MAYVDVRQPVTGRLLCRFDPKRDILEFVERKVKTVIDLKDYRAPESAKEIASERQENGCGENPGCTCRGSVTESDVSG